MQHRVTALAVIIHGAAVSAGIKGQQGRQVSPSTCDAVPSPRTFPRTAQPSTRAKASSVSRLYLAYARGSLFAIAPEGITFGAAVNAREKGTAVSANPTSRTSVAAPYFRRCPCTAPPSRRAKRASSASKPYLSLLVAVPFHRPRSDQERCHLMKAWLGWIIRLLSCTPSSPSSV